MKKQLLLLLLVLLPMVVMAKKKPEDKLPKMFQKAMKQSKQSNGYYLVSNISGEGLAGHSNDDIQKGDAITVKKLFQWAEWNSFVIMDYSVETWGNTCPATGDNTKDYVKNVYFLHVNDPVLVERRLAEIRAGKEISQVGVAGEQSIKTVYNKFKQPGDPEFGQLKKGNSFLFVAKSKYTGTDIYRIDDLYWSGDADNGAIKGTGVGIFKTKQKKIPIVLNLSDKSAQEGNSEEVYIYFKGSFSRGLISSRTLFRGNGNYDKASKQYPIKDVYVDRIDVYDLFGKQRDSFLAENINAYKKECLENDYPLLEKAYNQALSYAKRNATDIVPDECVARFISCYGDIDYKNKMALAKEISRFYDVCAAMNLIPKYSYIEEDKNIFGSFNGYYNWLDGTVYKESIILQKGTLALVSESKYGFSSFFKFCQPKINSKQEKFEAEVAEQKSIYDDWKQRKDADNKQKWRQRTAEAEAIEKGRVSHPAIKDVDEEDDSEYITFEDGTKGRLYHDRKGWSVNYGLLQSSRYYKTYSQAVKALYLYKKYNYESSDGRFY